MGPKELPWDSKQEQEGLPSQMLGGRWAVGVACHGCWCGRGQQGCGWSLRVAGDGVGVASRGMGGVCGGVGVAWSDLGHVGGVFRSVGVAMGTSRLGVL